MNVYNFSTVNLIFYSYSILKMESGISNKEEAKHLNNNMRKIMKENNS